MKTTLIITEKKRISESLVRALAPDTYDDFGNTSALHNDIITVRRLSRGEKVDNSGDRYFNIQGSFPYHINAQHLDHMGHKSARRIRRKIRYINEHIATDLERPVLEVIKDGSSIEYICSAIEGRGYPQIDMLDSQTESLQGAVERALTSLEQQGKVISQGESYFPTKEGTEFVKDNSSNLLVPEDINYFIFERDGSLVIVLDTYGNPLQYRKTTNGYLQKIIQDSDDWPALEKKLKLTPNFQAFNPRDLKSHVVRSFLFNYVLAKRRLPCDHNGMKEGHPLDLEKVVAATDLDIAGSSIFLSVIESANEFASKWNKQIVTPDMLYRMNMHTMEPIDIQEAYDNLKEFDWENAYAGKARSVFDFLYGSTISQQLRHFNKDPDLRLATGRTLFLGLKKLIEQERELKKESEEDYVYIAFNGLLDLNQINHKLEDRDYVLMHVKQKKNYVSHSKFLELCEQDEIGTHTTRYTLGGRLERLKVLSIIDNKLFSTPYGNVYLKVIGEHLDNHSNFNITQWSGNLQNIIAGWRTDVNDNRPQSMEEMEKEFQKFMRVFLPNLQAKFKYLDANKYIKITRELSKEYQRLKKFEFSQSKQEETYEVPDDTFVLVGNESALTLDNIKELIDPKSNTPKSNARSRIIRVIPQKPINLVDYVRRTFNISREYDFTVERGYNSRALLGMKNENYTVFRAKIPKGATLYDILSEGMRIDDYIECELDESNFEEEGEQAAHEALMVRDISRSDIAGRDGLRLAEEYHKPWYHTHDKLQKKANGQINVAGFSSGDHEFERIERYAFGVVHNFESLLIAMLDKYNIPFWKTAKLAEEMYLNAGR